VALLDYREFKDGKVYAVKKGLMRYIFNIIFTYTPTCYHGLLLQRAGDVTDQNTISLHRSEGGNYEGHLSPLPTLGLR